MIQRDALGPGNAPTAQGTPTSGGRKAALRGTRQPPRPPGRPAAAPRPGAESDWPGGADPALAQGRAGPPHSLFLCFGQVFQPLVYLLSRHLAARRPDVEAEPAEWAWERRRRRPGRRRRHYRGSQGSNLAQPKRPGSPRRRYADRRYAGRRCAGAGARAE